MNRRPRRKRQTLWNRSDHIATRNVDVEGTVDGTDHAGTQKGISFTKRRTKKRKFKTYFAFHRIVWLIYFICMLLVFCGWWGLYAWTRNNNHSVRIQMQPQLPLQIRSRRHPPSMHHSAAAALNSTTAYYFYDSEQLVFQKLMNTIKARMQQNAQHPIRTDQNGSNHTTRAYNERVHTASTDWVYESWLQWQWNENSSKSNCRVPWSNSTACDTTHYTILAVWSKQPLPGRNHSWRNETTLPKDQERQIRTIFLNCLRWLVDASVHSIHILLPSGTYFEAIQTNEAYGQRLLAWNRMEDSRVKIHFGTTFWDAWNQFLNQSERTTTTLPSLATTAVVWMQANEPWPGNQRGIRRGWNIWKEHAAALVTTGAFWQDPSSMRSKNSDIPSNLLRRVQETSFHGQISDANILVLPAFVDLLSTTFHHREYLCFLNHSILQRLRDQTDWDTAWLGISLLFSLIVPSVHFEQFEHPPTNERDSSMSDIILFHPNSNSTFHHEEMEKRHLDLSLEPFRHVVSLFGGMPILSDQLLDRKVKLMLEQPPRC